MTGGRETMKERRRGVGRETKSGEREIDKEKKSNIKNKTQLFYVVTGTQFCELSIY
jgi:hypothetical protein